MRKRFLALFLIALSPAAFAQDPAQVQKQFESGQYQQVVDSATPEAPPEVLYLAAQSQQKMGASDQAIELYRRLAARDEGDPWRMIGQSGQQLLEDQVDAAVDSARQAVQANGEMPDAHFQLGLALAKREAWSEAADEFDHAAELNPSLAYAHYYGGLMHYRAKRPDRMANHFDQFLKLAPDAPERPEVVQILRTARKH
jgi:tetratricopeptide (TPR) repeat protein